MSKQGNQEAGPAAAGGGWTDSPANGRERLRSYAPGGCVHRFCGDHLCLSPWREPSRSPSLPEPLGWTSDWSRMETCGGFCAP